MLGVPLLSSLHRCSALAVMTSFVYDTPHQLFGLAPDEVKTKWKSNGVNGMQINTNTVFKADVRWRPGRAQRRVFVAPKFCSSTDKDVVKSNQTTSFCEALRNVMTNL